MKAKKLNEQGLLVFSEYINKLRGGAKQLPPHSILEHESYTEFLPVDINIENKNFATRFEMGEYLCGLFDEKIKQLIIGETGFWSWLALFWFDQLCPPKNDGSRNPSKPYNYILSKDYRHRPRHAILTTWMLVDRYGEASYFMLSRSPGTRGELIEQIAARQYYISCQGVIEAASELYYDSNKKTFKRGSTTRKKPGTVDRYINFLQQIELTFDLYTIPKSEIIKLLPKEYNRFIGDDK